MRHVSLEAVHTHTHTHGIILIEKNKHKDMMYLCNFVACKII